MLLWFKDGADGFYQVEAPDGIAPIWTTGMTAISESEAQAILAPNVLDNVAIVKEQIVSIERETMMNRAVREGWLLLVEKEAMREFSVDQPTAVAGLYAGNLAYHKVKDIDNQIAALRAQIGEL